MAENVTVPDRGAATPTSTTGTSRFRVANSNTYTTDITDRFLRSASALRPGDLVKDADFTLFESVGALEIGDPKMDSGCYLDEENTTDDGRMRAQEFDVTKQLRPEEVIWLMDELLSHEVAWQMGYPLSQTLFTSVHIDALLWPQPLHLHEAQFERNVPNRNDDRLLHLVLRGYCLGVIKSCDLILQTIMSQHYYEDEDISTQSFNRELLRRFEVDEILQVVQDGILWLDGEGIDFEWRSKLQVRLRFRHELLSILHSFSGGIRHTSASLVERLNEIDDTSECGTPAPDAFSTRLQRKLASSVPPRPIIAIGKQQAIQFYRENITHMSMVFDVLSPSHSSDFLTSMIVFCAPNPQPSTYLRSLVQSFLDYDGKVCRHKKLADFIFEDLSTITLAGSPISITHDRNSSYSSITQDSVSRNLSSFISRISTSYLNLFRAMTLNRCRVRRNLCHAILEWDEIQAEAEDLDEQLQTSIGERPVQYQPDESHTYSYSVSSWIYHYKLLQLRQIVQMGFELDVYGPAEMAGMYWYLSHICQCHISHLERISFFIEQRDQDKFESQEEHANAEVTRSHPTSKKTHEVLYQHFGLLKAVDALARALHGLHVVVHRRGAMGRNTRTYATDSLRYEMRMRPFKHLSIPEPIHHSTFKRMSFLDPYTDEVVLQRASDAAVLAATAWGQVLKTGWNAFEARENVSHAASESNRGHRGPNAVTTIWEKKTHAVLDLTLKVQTTIQTLRGLPTDEAGFDSRRNVDAAQFPMVRLQSPAHPEWIVPVFKMETVDAANQELLQ